MTFGKWVEIARKDKGWSLRAMARICGFHASHIRQIELGYSDPGIFTAMAMAQALGFELWEALKIVEESK